MQLCLKISPLYPPKKNELLELFCSKGPRKYTGSWAPHNLHRVLAHGQHLQKNIYYPKLFKHRASLKAIRTR